MSSLVLWVCIAGSSRLNDIANITQQNPYKLAFTSSLAIFFAYFPLGIVFGVLFVHLGFTWYLAPIMSLLVYAGAAQFVALGIMAIHGTYFEIFLATVFIALRNAFYGISFLERFKNTKWFEKTYLIFGLVDANYAIMVTNTPLPDAKQDKKFCIYLAFLLHLYWVAGTFLGAAFANLLPSMPGLAFVLPCFFMTLVIEQYLKVKTIKPFMIALVAVVIAMLISPKYMLLIAIGLTVVLLLFYFRYEAVT